MLDHVWGELDADAPRTEESTRRIAACNMDWDRIRAVDIMVLCHSFLPPGGVVQKVSVIFSIFYLFYFQNSRKITIIHETIIYLQLFALNS